MAGSTPSVNTSIQTNTTANVSYAGPLIVLTSLFFMWGFITSMNDILIPFMKLVFELSRTQSMFVQTAFFTAYFVGSLIYFIISSQSGDPIAKIGYKTGLIWGLVISAIGCFMFYPAAEIKQYWLFLSALFVLGIGFTLLQIAANPYVSILGRPETASSRLNLSQAFNSFGTTIAPILGGFLVFKFFNHWGEPFLNQMGEVISTEDGKPMSGAGVKLPYMIFGSIFILLGLLIFFTKLPQFSSDENIEKGAGALKYPHLVLGMLAIFMYVGAEVSIGSLIINYLNELLNLTEMEAASYLAFYWGGAMIGRFLGAVSLSDMQSKIKKYGLMAVLSVFSFLIIFLAVYVESGFKFQFSNITPFIIFLVLNYFAFLAGKSKAGRTLTVFALIVISLLVVTMLSTGAIAMWSVIAIGLFNSIMWSNIFTLAIKDLGKYTAQGSSLLVMAILGGALVPVLQGKVADMLGGYHYSFFVPVFCYVYLAYYGWKGHRVIKPKSN